MCQQRRCGQGSGVGPRGEYFQHLTDHCLLRYRLYCEGQDVGYSLVLVNVDIPRRKQSINEIPDYSHAREQKLLSCYKILIGGINLYGGC